MKYLITTEDGQSYSANSISDDDLYGSDIGVLTIVDIENESIHVGGDEWSPIEKWEQQ